MRLVEHGGGRILGGSMAFRRRNGEVLDLAQTRDSTMRGIRGADIAMIFQEPMTSLNPVFTAGDQIAEAIRIHQGKNNAAARAEALRMLELVRIPEARNVLDRFPHQLSGGMRRRVALLMSLAVEPRILLLDEPFGALDTHTKTHLHRELMEIWRKLGQTIVMVTHDLDEAILLSDRVVVLSGPPSRVLLDERIRIPHPRDVFTLRETPQFVAHVQSLWSVLGQQFRAAA
jgi:ABC-type dipeptide/oligopeptide/nickel transport system ATPase component